MRHSPIVMMAVVVILVVIAAGQGIYNLVKECHKEFELIDPADTFVPAEVPKLKLIENESADIRKAA